MQIHPIKNEKDYERAVARISQLMSAAPGTCEGEELDVLATLVDAYETKHYLMDAPDPVVAIKFRMEQEGLTRKDLEPLIGSRARVSEILNRKRSLTLEMVRRLRRALGISADALIADGFAYAGPSSKRNASKRPRASSKPVKKTAKRWHKLTSRRTAGSNR